MVNISNRTYNLIWLIIVFESMTGVFLYNPMLKNHFPRTNFADIILNYNFF
jgi:hypothetical protein